MSGICRNMLGICRHDQPHISTGGGRRCWDVSSPEFPKAASQPRFGTVRPVCAVSSSMVKLCISMTVCCRSGWTWFLPSAWLSLLSSGDLHGDLQPHRRAPLLISSQEFIQLFTSVFPARRPLNRPSSELMFLWWADSDSGESQIAGRGQNSRQHSGPEVLQPPCSSQTSQSTGWMWWAVFRLACCCLIQI